jgi:hypothetical protein
MLTHQVIAFVITVVYFVFTMLGVYYAFGWTGIFTCLALLVVAYVNGWMYGRAILAHLASLATTEN